MFRSEALALPVRSQNRSCRLANAECIWNPSAPEAEGVTRGIEHDPQTAGVAIGWLPGSF